MAFFSILVMRVGCGIVIIPDHCQSFYFIGIKSNGKCAYIYV